MPKARTHDENRNQICLLCFGKTKEMLLFKERLKELVNKHVEYDETDERLPRVLCATCKRDLSRIEAGSEQCVRLPNFFDLQTLRKSTRSSDTRLCDCQIYELARKPADGNFAIGNILPKRQSILRKKTNTQVSSKFKYTLGVVDNLFSTLHFFYASIT